MKVDPNLDVQNHPQLNQPASTRFESGPSSLINAPIADDFSEMFSQEVARNATSLSERQLGLRTPPAEQLVQLYEQLGHPAQAKMATIARNVRGQLLLRAGVGKIMQITGNDPARAYVVLKHVALQADAEGRTAEASLARSSLTDLENHYQPQIQAGLNTAMALQAGSDDPQMRQAVRSLYYTSVVTTQSLATLMQSLLGLYGEGDFETGLKLIRRALADDIAAQTSSVDRGQLRTLLLGLNDCSRLSGVLARCKELIGRSLLLYPELHLDPLGLLQRLLGYAANGLTPHEIKHLARDLGGSELSHQLSSLGAFFPELKALPLAWWCDARRREEAVNSYKQVLLEYAMQERGARHTHTWPGLKA
ncbi:MULTISPECIES: type III secretion system gatekeeper subunit SctW [Pseudomonas]|uniref:type III secretion system gatekeeper subunit SctW n=1 Tax=Pseudomonas TaxID=286 RepID=UPI0014729B03|nr:MULTISPECIES: type III secretion system gatekeeper subunit SctW [Pseudomonas]MBJ2241698.1 type III secretion system gatekeeper subunit SctW [Pseudomonas sp. MF6768]MBJ2263872.1 type III secretion system gatekeeper subunit SctW [Pseudomonas sp. MF6787]MBJ2291139.1 type III secretion system gatekeeper subunit SctW [Pseudomonas sp. MF5691]MDI3204372.1 type III secretion system gatekeeper subunit SctW [Pseudomonas shahriarae]NMX34144.1 type III secretion system gatekeeper subunit SctW [Pseudomo